MLATDLSSMAKILVVDDEAANLEIIEHYLIEAGYQNVQTTVSPHNAIKHLQTEVFDLILLDIMMPDLSGFDVLKRINNQRLQTGPIIVVTAKNDDETKIRALETEGVRDYLAKPFLESELLIRVRNLLEVHFAQKQILDQNQILDRAVRERTAELEDRNFQLRENQIEMIERIGLAAEFRDNETGFHVDRMSRYASALGIEIGLNQSESRLLLVTAPMHDVGKIGIPDSILLKPGKLDKHEWVIMKRHPGIGARILSDKPSKKSRTRRPSKLIATGRIISLTHHERWDGKGYPRGLKGDDIPLFGRIVSVADVFDALTSKRPYKEAWTIERALEAICEGGGSQFDPKIVNAFVGIQSEILKIKQSYQEEEKSWITLLVVIHICL